MLDELESLKVVQTDVVGALPGPETASCEQAWQYEISTASRNAVYCSRRAGKTFTGRRRAVRVACSGPNRWVHVVSLIRRNAKKHWWSGIKALLTELGWQYQPWEQDMILRLSNGSYIQALGIDDVADVKKLQGDFSNLIIGDEAHLPNDNVQVEFYKAAVPMLDDYGGAFDWLGLPPKVEGTEFDKAILSPEWKAFNWNSLEHDYPEPREKKRARIEAEIQRRGLTWESPEVQQIYLGKRVRNPADTAYEYMAGRNDYDAASMEGVFGNPGWLHSVGIDLGFQDRDAVVVLAWRPDDMEKRVYARFIWQRNHLSTDSLAQVVGLVQNVYRPVAWTGDTGGHGAVKVLETLKQRLRIHIAVKPPDVLVSLGYVNDDLRTGRLLLPTTDTETPRVAHAARLQYAERPSELSTVLDLLNGAWASAGHELSRVPKIVKPTTMKMVINPPGPNHSDISEALRYAHAGAQNWLAAQAVAPKRLTAEEREEADEQEERESAAGKTWYQRQASRGGARPFAR